MKKIIGGNIINSFTLEEKFTLFANDAYKYYKVFLEDGEEHNVSDLESYSIYLIETPGPGHIEILEKNQKTLKGQAILIENLHLTFKAHGKCLLFIAGINEKVYEGEMLSILNKNEIKIVKKPWGHERWINGEHKGYAFKNIFIKKGTRTSLQYHELKRETNILLEGEAKLHYKKNEEVSNDEVKDHHVAQFALLPKSSIDVWPHILHRLEAVSDNNLFEVSTPHLDDVIRVQDNSNRVSGRIETEHAPL